MILLDSNYWFGVSAAAYLVTCWMFAAVRWFHTCRAPKEQHAYIWPDRRLQVVFYLIATSLLPYVLNPQSQTAWTLWKSYFPGTYFFYCGALLFCFFGSVKQWNRWRNTNWVAAIITIFVMAPLVLDAWIPDGMMTHHAAQMWSYVVVAASIGMMGYCILAMWQVAQWTKEARDENYSNPDDYPSDYASHVWHMPVGLSLLVWPAYILDSPHIMAVINILLSAFNVLLLIIALPPWRRTTLMAEEDTAEQEEEEDDWRDEQAEERARKIADEIETFVNKGKGYLDPHLRIDHVVEHCSYSRTYVSHVFKTRFGGFSRYVNTLRLAHYDVYMTQHPNATKETAAQESGFSSYIAYYKVKDRLERG